MRRNVRNAGSGKKRERIVRNGKESEKRKGRRRKRRNVNEGGGAGLVDVDPGVVKDAEVAAANVVGVETEKDDHDQEVAAEIAVRARAPGAVAAEAGIVLAAGTGRVAPVGETGTEEETGTEMLGLIQNVLRSKRQLEAAVKPQKKKRKGETRVVVNQTKTASTQKVTLKKIEVPDWHFSRFLIWKPRVPP